MKYKMIQMKQINAYLVFALCMVCIQPATAANDTTRYFVQQWLTAGPVPVIKPAFSEEKNLHGKQFKTIDLLKFNRKKMIAPKKGDSFLGEKVRWKIEASSKQNELNVLKTSNGELSIYWQAVYLHVAEFTKVKFEVTTRQSFELFVDHKKKSFNDTPVAKSKEPVRKKTTVSLEPGRHLLVIQSIYMKDTTHTPWKTKVSYTIENNLLQPLVVNTSPECFMDIDHLMHGQQIGSVSVSPSGDYYLLQYSETYPPNGKSEQWSVIKSTVDGKTIFSSRDSDISNIRWVPNRNEISFTANRGGEKVLLSLNLETRSEKILMKGMKHFTGYTWAKDGSFLIYSISDNLKRDPSGVYEIEGMPDRWPWYRTRSQLFILRRNNLASSQLTYGHLTNNLQDISYDNRHILFSQSLPQYSQRPYFKQYMLQMDLVTLKVDTLWEQNFSSSANYSPDGKKLIVTGSASLFNGAGIHLKKAKIPNDYDTQAYLYTLATGRVDPISRNFNPSIVDAHWNRSDNALYFLTEDRTYRNIWRYHEDTKAFEPLPMNVDVVNHFSFSEKNNLMVYSGSSITHPAEAYLYNLHSNKQKLIANPEKLFFANVTFGKTEDWTFKNKKGLTIDGRIYYPPHFNPAKKYPLIVYYYGGTSPTARNFRGRYPKNLFAAYGYVVYDLQPSGATGYGQDFSALHVNRWGMNNAEDIIEGTKKFLKAHPFVNKKAVGCMGASYGGYMTMYLQTRTDIFATAIAHAGISSIASYWGQGYWGYLYSAVASANSFPWNNRKLYVDHSPLFNADKVHTPILLLHGTADTNVPTGESIQFYTALKLLGKPVELVEIKGQNHHIMDYKKRIRWQKTIMAWFDKYLKGENDWWHALYPKKNL